MTSTADFDELFRRPLSEFTAARNALAARLKKAGHDDQAAQVKALAKPSIAAWVVNQLYWQHRKPFDRLIAAGERFRTAQAAQLAGRKADLRGPLEERRDALARLTRTAAAILRDAGHPATPEMMRRITTTLEALATYGTHPGAPPPGRLTDEVAPPGFEALAALIPRVGGNAREGDEPTRVLPFQQKARASNRKVKVSPEEDARRREEERRAAVAAARSALLDAERAAREARQAAARAEAALKKAAARAKEAERDKTDLEPRYEKAVAAAEQARQDARRVAAAAEDAAQAVEDAERAVDAARARLQELETT